jgi:hypothetical protein
MADESFALYGDLAMGGGNDAAQGDSLVVAQVSR